MNKIEDFDRIVALYGHENIFFSMGYGDDVLAYYVHAIFNHEGILNSKDFLQFMFDSVLTDQQKEVFRQTSLFGPFHVFAELEDFCIKLAQFAKEDSVSVISTTEFNEIVQISSNVESLYSALTEQARIIELDEQQKKRGFFSNLFG